MSESLSLLETVRRVSRERRLSRKTENAYANHIRRFQDFYAERDLQEVGAGGINDFLKHLQQTENLGAAACNQALSALAFLYREVFGRAACFKKVARTKIAGKKPVVFTPEEAKAVLAEMRGESFLVAALMYGAGLRLSEAVALRVGDIDFEACEIVVRDAQTNRRSRRTVLPAAIVPALERHLRNVRYVYEDDQMSAHVGVLPPPFAARRQQPDEDFEWRWQFAFPSHNLTSGDCAYRHHLAESTVQKAVADALGKVRIGKKACPQTFRYSFAVRLYERKTDVRDIQLILGHKNLKTTVNFINCFGGGKISLQSPLDF